MDVTPLDSLGASIRKLRERTGMGQEPFAERCVELFSGLRGMNQGSLSRMERDKMEASPEHLRAIVAAAGGTSEDLSHLLSLLVGVPVAVRDDSAAA